MEVAAIGNHLVGVCPFCDLLFDCSLSSEMPTRKIIQKQMSHLLDSPKCRQADDALPKLSEWFDVMPAIGEAVRRGRGNA